MGLYILRLTGYAPLVNAFALCWNVHSLVLLYAIAQTSHRIQSLLGGISGTNPSLNVPVSPKKL